MEIQFNNDISRVLFPGCLINIVYLNRLSKLQIFLLIKTFLSFSNVLGLIQHLTLVQSFIPSLYFWNLPPKNSLFLPLIVTCLYNKQQHSENLSNLFSFRLYLSCNTVFLVFFLKLLQINIFFNHFQFHLRNKTTFFQHFLLLHSTFSSILSFSNWIFCVFRFPLFFEFHVAFALWLKKNI